MLLHNSYLHFRVSSDLHAAIFCLSCSSLSCDAFCSIIVLPYFCNPSFNLGIKSQSVIRLNSFIICEKERKEKSNVTWKKREERQFNIKFTQWHNRNISETISIFWSIYLPIFLSLLLLNFVDYDNTIKLGRGYFRQ